MKSRVLAILILAACIAGVGTAEAGSLQSSVQVSATVVAACVAATSPVNFGNVQLTGDATASGQIVVLCNGQVPYDIALDAGLHYDGAWRGVMYFTERLSYGLYTPTNTEWGDAGFAGTYTWGDPVSAVGTGSPQTHVVNGILWAGDKLVTPGPYSDVVKVTLHF